MNKPKKPEPKAPQQATILVAIGELRGGTIDEKTGERVPAVLADGGELTAAKAEALGLDDNAVGRLVELGKLVELKVRQAEGGDDGEALAAAIARAEAAEAKVADLQKQLDAAKAPAKTAPAAQ